MTGPSRGWLADGKRLHFHHGPIDLIIEADGDPDSVATAYRQAWRRFETILEELVAELPRLRTVCPPERLGLKGRTARRMEAAVKPHAACTITPMAAVAGAVADEVLAAMIDGLDLKRAYVNNGGDIALALSQGERFEIAMVAMPEAPSKLGSISLGAGDPKGIATSGRHGRSHSLGIADSVTVLADSAAAADAAATLVANAVDLPDSPHIKRVAARDLDPESDLGDRLVTVDVDPLAPEDIARALAAGAARARLFQAQKILSAATLCLQGQIQIIGDWPSRASDRTSDQRTPPSRLDSPKSADYKNHARSQSIARPR